MEGITSDHGAEDMPVVNALREDVKKWRNSNYENATQVTKQLPAACGFVPNDSTSFS